MMMSDSLPFTPYDSMEYQTVSPQVPTGFTSRDKVADVQQKDLKKMMRDGPSSNSMQVPVEPIPMQQRPVLQDNKPNKPYKPENTQQTQGTYVKIEKRPSLSKKDIGNYKQVYDLVYILVAVLVVEVAIIFLVRYSPEIFGQVLNRWYDKFGLCAVVIDVSIIIIGFMLTRYVYSEYIKQKYAKGKWDVVKFLGTLVGITAIHDLLFYYGIINQVPSGHNSIIDTFKDYSAAGPKIIAGDSIIMVLSAGIAMLLKSQPSHILASIGTLAVYIIPYILQTKNQYSS